MLITTGTEQEIKATAQRLRDIASELPATLLTNITTLLPAAPGGDPASAFASLDVSTSGEPATNAIRGAIAQLGAAAENLRMNVTQSVSRDETF